MNLLQTLTGGSGTADKPITVNMTHDLAPLKNPVLEGALVIIAGCLLLMLINQAVRKK